MLIPVRHLHNKGREYLRFPGMFFFNDATCYSTEFTTQEIKEFQEKGSMKLDLVSRPFTFWMVSPFYRYKYQFLLTLVTKIVN